jgi:hypothetical protein
MYVYVRTSPVQFRGRFNLSILKHLCVKIPTCTDNQRSSPLRKIFVGTCPKCFRICNKHDNVARPKMFSTSSMSVNWQICPSFAKDTNSKNQ